MKRREQPEKLHLPASMNYDCLMCGRGCTDFWEIPLDKESEEELSRLPLQDYQQRGKNLPPFVDSQFDAGERALCRIDDVCVFMTPERKCALHQAHGPLMKPQTCIDFPFRYVDTPGGTYVGLSFACTAVLQDHGAPVEEKRASLGENYERSIHVKKTADRPLLTGRIAVDYDAYAEIERAFVEILAIPNTVASQKLLCQSVLLDLIVGIFEAARLGEGKKRLSAEEIAAAKSATDLELVRQVTEHFRRDQWGRLLLMAKRRPASAAFHRAFVGLIATFRQALWRGANRWTATGYIARHYVRHALRIGRVHLQPFPERFSFDEFTRRSIDVSPGSEFDRAITRYFEHVIFRKDLLLSESIRTGHRFLLLHYALIVWYVTGMMVNRGELDASADTIRESLCHVEKYYVLHSTYGRYLERQPVLGTLVDRAINTTAYPGSMVRRPV